MKDAYKESINRRIVKVAISLFSLLISLFFLSDISSATDNPYEFHYPFKTAVIHYKVTGAEIGEEILYIKPDFQALFLNIQYSYLGKMKPRKHLTLTTPEYVYSIDFIKNKGTKLYNPRKKLIDAFDSLSKKERIVVKKNVEELGTAFLGNLWGKRAPLYEKILGINCDLIEIFGERALIWPEVNIPLKRNRTLEFGSALGDKIVTTVFKIDKNVPIGPGKYEIPEGILITNHRYLPDRFEATGNIVFKFDKIERNDDLESTVMLQFHGMREPDAVKRAKEKIARKVIKIRLDANDTGAEISKDIDDSIFADQEVLINPDVILEIQLDYEDEIKTEKIDE